MWGGQRGRAWGFTALAAPGISRQWAIESFLVHCLVDLAEQAMSAAAMAVCVDLMVSEGWSATRRASYKRGLLSSELVQPNPRARLAATIR